MITRRLHIGTSGWSYKHWRGLFYPDKLRTADWFSFYATQFDSSEINRSFYSLPKYETVQDWASKAPEGFSFCPKLSRYLTHMKKLRDPEEPLERFFSVFEPLFNRMGPVLIQLPSLVKFSYDLAQNFYRALSYYREREFVLEVRHPSWLEEASLLLLSKYGIGLVISQSDNLFPYSEIVTAKNIYLRFHGPKELYASAYSAAELELYAQKIRQWLNEGHTVWAYFNNDIHGYAPEDARRLKALLEGTSVR